MLIKKKVVLWFSVLRNYFRLPTYIRTNELCSNYNRSNEFKVVLCCMNKPERMYLLN